MDIKTCVLYHSGKGSTRKVAGAIALGLGTVATAIENIDHIDLASAQLLVLGTPVHGDYPADEIKFFLENHQALPANIAIFCTHAADYDMMDSPLSCLEFMTKELQKKGSAVISSFSVRGENSDQTIIDWLKANMPERVAGALSSKGHPDQDELNKARQWGERLFKRLSDSKEGK